ncbi:MAG: carbohydrate ABC transporter permease [Alicyclobacillus sp.]|nr:carbohydrate ABC transporter permease [Alicyclobacillus sp.]
MTAQTVVRWGLRWSFLLLMLILLDFPFFIMLITSVKTLDQVYNPQFPLLPQRWVWGNYTQLWKQVGLGMYFGNSLKIAVGATALTLILAMPAAYTISRFRFAGRRVILGLLLVIQMFSPIVVLLPLYRMFADYHLLDNLWSLVIINATFSVSFAVWFIYSYFDSIPVEIDEAARMDGCNRLQSMFRVVVPLSLPAILTSAIFTFINAWNEFLFAMTFIQDNNLMPITIGLYNFVGRYHVQWNYLMGASLLSTLPVLILFLFIHRQLIKGLVAGAIK